MRVFVAIEMPEAVREALEAVQEQLPAGRPVPEDQMHLTLAFLGEQPDAAVDAMHEALSELRARPFTLSLHGIETLGGHNPRVLAAGVAPSPDLTRLHERVRGCAHSAGILLERRRFRPHVTLARFSRPPRRDALALLRRFLEGWAAVPLPEVEVREIALLRSILRPEGALHEALCVYPLAGPGA